MGGAVALRTSVPVPPFPQTLEIDKTDSHIPTAAATTSKVGKNLQKEPSEAAQPTQALQAHSWIGKDCILPSRSAGTESV